MPPMILTTIQTGVAVSKSKITRIPVPKQVSAQLAKRIHLYFPVRVMIMLMRRNVGMMVAVSGRIAKADWGIVRSLTAWK